MEEDFLAELKSLVSTMLANLTPRRVPVSRETWRLLLPLVLAAFVLFILFLLLAKIVTHIQRKRHTGKLLEQFGMLLSEVDAVLGSPPFIARCVSLGEEIDVYTNRLENSKLIAMLSYRIALKTRMCPEQAALCSCCALVADAGMLDLPRQLFFREILTGRERKLLRDQCRAFIYQLDFVPSGYLQFFVETCSCRKENMDGSGYPEGLKGGDIPVLARIVRAAEDYTAMPERKARKYLVPLSSRAAVREMRKSAELYDQRIVNIIEKLV